METGRACRSRRLLESWVPDEDGEDKARPAAGPPVHFRAVRGAVVGGVQPSIRRLLPVTPTGPATVVAERVDLARLIEVLRDGVLELLTVPPRFQWRAVLPAGAAAGP